STRTRSRSVERLPAGARCDVGDPEAGERKRQLGEHRLDHRHLEVVRAALEHDVEPRVREEERPGRRGGGGQPRVTVPGGERGQQERSRGTRGGTGTREGPNVPPEARGRRGRRADRPRPEGTDADTSEEDERGGGHV